MNDAELLGRIARTLKEDVGPEVADEYARTQAYLGAVVLQKLARQLALAPAHDAARSADYAELADDLRALLPADAPARLAAALDAFDAARDADALAGLVGALHEAGTALAGETSDVLLARVRRTLRADLDRRLEIAR